MLKDWNVEFGKDLTSVNGRVLPQEKVFQKESQVLCIMINIVCISIVICCSCDMIQRVLTGLVG